MSTRAGRVRSSNNSRQARPKRADTSGAVDLGTGTGTRARRGASCAASSSPRKFSIAPRRLPPRSPQGRGRALSGLPQASPRSPHGVAMGTMGDRGPQGMWSPGAGRRVPKSAQAAGPRDGRALSRVWAVGCGVSGSGARSAAGARARGQPQRPQLSLDGAGRGRGHARPSARLRPRQPGCSPAP